MRLRTLLNDEPKELVGALESCGIRTDEDLLYSSDSSVALFQRMPPGSVVFSDLERIKERVLHLMSAEGRSGAQLVEDITPHAEGTLDCSTGSSVLNSILQSSCPGVIEVAGRKGSGKTSLVLNIALARLASAPDTIVHWIDTTGDFSAEHASEILKAGRPMQSPSSSMHSFAVNTSSATLLERLHVSLAFKADAVHGLLMAAIAAGVESAGSLGLVVIDAITPLFAPHLAAGSSEGHATMTAFMRELHQIAISHNILVLVTNGATSAAHASKGNVNKASIQMKPSLGPSFTYLTDTTLWLTRTSEASSETYEGLAANDQEDADETYVVEVLRSRSTRSGVCWLMSFRGGVLLEMTVNAAS